MSKWISVDKRLPSKDENYPCFGFSMARVIVNVNGYGPKIDRYVFEKEEFLSNDAEFITHWMPLPEPPEGES